MYKAGCNKKRGYAIRVFFIGIVYILLNIFIWKRSVHWFHNLHNFLHKRWFTALFSVIYMILASSPAIYIFFNNKLIKAAVKYISNIWIGFFIYGLIFMALSWLITFLLRQWGKVNQEQPGWRRFVIVRGIVVMICILGFSVYGVVHAGTIKTTNYNIAIDKHCEAGDKLKIVLVADMHMGYSVGEKQMEKMVTAINEQKPDLVCMAGDIFDNDYAAVQNPERLIALYRKIKSKYGVYACYGNHDVAEKLVGGFSLPMDESPSNEKEMYVFLEKAGVRLLEDQSQLVGDSFYLIGRRDYTKPGTQSKTRASIQELTASLDKTKPILLMDHQPKELRQTANAGVDLVMSGHTHDGQLFPANLVIHLFWEKAYGYLKKDKLHSIVTSGVGVWGPAMRVGTDSEVVAIEVSFSKK